jgi:plasmid stabilization system protein ParE
MRIRWSPEAAEDLERIVRWIQQNSPRKIQPRLFMKGLRTFRLSQTAAAKDESKVLANYSFLLSLILRSIG